MRCERRASAWLFCMRHQHAWLKVPFETTSHILACQHRVGGRQIKTATRARDIDDVIVSVRSKATAIVSGFWSKLECAGLLASQQGRSKATTAARQILGAVASVTAEYWSQSPFAPVQHVKHGIHGIRVNESVP